MSKEQLILTCLLCLGSLSILGVFYLHAYNKANREVQDSIFITRTKKVRVANYYPIYKFMSNFILTRRYLAKLKLQYEILIPGDVAQARDRATKVLLIIWSVCGLVVVGALLLQPSLFLFCAVCLTIYILHIQIIVLSVEHLNAKIIKELSNFISNVRKEFISNHGMIVEAIYDVINKASPLMQAHGEALYEVLLSDNLDFEVEEYASTIPNDLLKQFMAICVPVQKYGDTKVNGQSLFITAIKNLQQDIAIESLKREKIKSAFTLLIPICIIPVYLIQIIDNWGMQTLPELENYFKGSYGTMVTVGAVAITIACYSSINYLKESNAYTLYDHDLLVKICNNKGVKKVLDNYSYRNYSKMLKLKELLKRTGSNVNENQFMVKRVLYGCVAGIVAVIILITAHAGTTSVTLNEYGTMSNSTTGATEKDSIVMMLLCQAYTNTYAKYDLVKAYNRSLKNSSENSSAKSSVDADVLKVFQEKLITLFDTESIAISDESAIQIGQQFYRQHSKTKLQLGFLSNQSVAALKAASDKQIRSALTQIYVLRDRAGAPKALTRSTLNDAVAKEVVTRVIRLQNNYFHWYEILLVIGCWIFLYMAPLWVLEYRKKELQLAMENEVIRFQSIIMILMHIKRMTVTEILNWLSMFAVIFRDSIDKCINELPSGDLDALENLIEEEPFEEFQRVIENLISSDKIGLEEAFNEIEGQRINYQEHRAQHNAVQIDNHAAFGLALSYIPGGFVFIFRMLIPLVYESFRQLQAYMSELSNM